MLGSIKSLSFETIERMVKERVCESEVLDYKEEFPRPKDIAKLVAAFANTYGGWIVVGVREEDDSNAPKEIVQLRTSDKDLQESLIAACFDNITPPVIPESVILA